MLLFPPKLSFIPPLHYPGGDGHFLRFSSPRIYQISISHLAAWNVLSSRVVDCGGCITMVIAAFLIWEG